MKYRFMYVVVTMEVEARRKSHERRRGEYAPHLGLERESMAPVMQ